MKILKQEEYLALREGARVLETDPHGDKVLRLSDGTIFKLFRRKRLISSAAWYPYAQRFSDNATALDKLGIVVPAVIGVFRIPDIARDAVHYIPLQGMTLREVVRTGLDKERERRLKADFTRLVTNLHNKGVYFRSLHIGNVICLPDDTLGLIDISDLRIHRGPLSNYWRARNLRRMQGIIEEADWLDYDTVMSRRLGEGR